MIVGSLTGKCSLQTQLSKSRIPLLPSPTRGEGSNIDDLDYCVVDTETTGGSAATNRVIDVAVFHYRDGIILDRFQSLLNPGVPIPEWITALTGINNDMVRHAPRFSDIADQLKSFFEKGIFVAHNAGFDFGFIQNEFLRLGRRWERPKICTVKLARILFPELSSRSLGALCDHLLIDIYDRHRAAGDAEATVYVLKHLLKKVRAEHGISQWDELQVFLSSGPLQLPPGINLSEVAHLPEAPGSYVLKGFDGCPLFTGKSTNIRRRIKDLFKRSNQSKRSNRFRETARSIEILPSQAVSLS